MAKAPNADKYGLFLNDRNTDSLLIVISVIAKTPTIIGYSFRPLNTAGAIKLTAIPPIQPPSAIAR